MARPLATVAVTAFNAEDTIERALTSALAQDWRPIEILVADDASTDATAARVAAMAARHPEIRLIRHARNQGVAAARNSLLEAAAGEFIVFFDDDDESLPHRVTAQIARIETYESRFAPDGPVICHAARLQTAPDGNQRIEATMGGREAVPAPQGRAVAERILMGRPLVDGYGALATCSQAARRSTYDRVGGFDPAFRRSEDTDLSIRLALADAHFVGVAEPLVRQTLTLASDKTLTAEREAMLALLDKHQAVFDSVRAHAFARRWTALKFDWLAGRRGRFAAGLLALALRRPIETGKRLIYALPMSASRAGVRDLHRHGPGAGGAG